MQSFNAMLFQDTLEKNKRIFKIPVYQRKYDWTITQCEVLYKDVINAYRKDHKHFFGTIVYIEHEFQDSDGSSFTEALVIDGQQRLTTVYLFLKALYDLGQNKEPFVVGEIGDVIFNKHCSEQLKLKLQLIKGDQEQLALLFNNQLQDMNADSNIYKNYLYLKNSIENSLKTAPELELKNIFRGIKKLHMVEIKLNLAEGDEPQKIFESINSTGLDLSLADLVRNYLLMDDRQQEKLYDNYWLQIEKNAGYSKLEDFIINYLNAKVPSKVNKKNAYQTYKDFYERVGYNHEKALQELKEYSNYYGAFVRCNDKDNGKDKDKAFKPYNVEITALLQAFLTIKQTTVYPLLFKLFHDYEVQNIDAKVLCKVMHYVLTYLIRLLATDINKNINNFMKCAYDRAMKIEVEGYYEKFALYINSLKSKDRMPDDTEFKAALMHNSLYKKPICKYCLEVIENAGKEKLDMNELTIEHIMPQSKNSAVWKREVGRDYDRVHEMYLHTLGNLTISGYNTELGTKSLKEKQKLIKAVSKANILNKDVLSAITWNEEIIKKRAERLADILLAKFKYDVIELPVNENSGVPDHGYSLNSEIDVTDMVPSGFVLLGEERKAGSWQAVLKEFLELAYSLEEKLMKELAYKDYKPAGASKVYLSFDKKKIKFSKPLGDTGIFYETNMSSNNILSFIRNVMEELKLEEEDFYYFLSFDIENPETYGELKVGKLAKTFFTYLLNNKKLRAEEIEKLLDKECTNKLFSKTYYAALTFDVNANSQGKNKRYYTDGVKLLDGRIVYITREWFEEERESIIEYFLQHKE